MSMWTPPQSSRQPQQTQRRMGFWGVGLSLLAVCTAVFFFLGSVGDDTRWLGWMSMLSIGAVYSVLGGMRVDFSLTGQYTVLVTGLTVGAIIVMLQLLLSAAIPHNVFIHASVTDSVLLALMAGVAEELFFRGFLQSSLVGFFSNERTKDLPLTVIMGVVPASLVFALFHYFAYGQDYRVLFVLFVGGIVLGLSYEMTNDIGVPILAHTLNNTIATFDLSWSLFAQYWYVIIIPVIIAIPILVYASSSRRRGGSVDSSGGAQR